MLVAAPARVFKTVSFWLAIVGSATDLVVGLLKAFEVAHVMDGNTLLLVNAGWLFLVGLAKLIQQQIALTKEQKQEMVEAVLNAPTKPSQVLPNTEPQA